MCRGGKDGQIKRCKAKAGQQAKANLRKQVKYRADKEKVSVDAWKQANPDSLQALVAKLTPTSRLEVPFQPISDTRRLPEGVPDLISEHIKMSKDHIDTILSPDEQKALSGYTGFAADAANSFLLKRRTVEQALRPNAPLWRDSEDGGPYDFGTKEDLEDYLETMDHVLSERKDAQRVLYRGIPIYSPLHAEIENSIGKKFDVSDTETMMEGLNEFYKPGKVFEFPSYVSTTHSAFYAADRSANHDGTNITYYDNPEVKGIMFEMKTNAGLDVTGVAGHNSYEREVILPRDTRYRVESISLRPEKYDTVSGYDFLDDPDEREEKTFTSMAVVVQMVEVDKDGNDLIHTEPHKPSTLNLA